MPRIWTALIVILALSVKQPDPERPPPKPGGEEEDAEYAFSDVLETTRSGYNFAIIAKEIPWTGVRAEKRCYQCGIG